jgi:hypothetical protein
VKKERASDSELRRKGSAPIEGSSSLPQQRGLRGSPAGYDRMWNRVLFASRRWHGMSRRIEMEADQIGELRSERRVVRPLEGMRPALICIGSRRPSSARRRGRRQTICRITPISAASYSNGPPSADASTTQGRAACSRRRLRSGLIVACRFLSEVLGTTCTVGPNGQVRTTPASSDSTKCVKALGWIVSVSCLSEDTNRHSLNRSGWCVVAHCTAGLCRVAAF